MNMKAKKLKTLCYLLLSLGILTGCSSTKYVYVDVPPKFDLKRWKSIGIFNVETSSTPDLSKKASQKFIQTIQAAQPGVAIVELGDRASFFGEGQENSELLAGDVKRVKEKSNVDALFFFTLDIGEPKTKIKFSGLSVGGLSAKKKVLGELTGKLFETSAGGVVWTNSSRGEYLLSAASLTSVTIKDSDHEYNKMVNDLVHNISPDFRPTRKRERVKK